MIRKTQQNLIPVVSSCCSLRGSLNFYRPQFHVEANNINNQSIEMADSVDYSEELEKLAKEIPEGIDMEEFVANVSKLAAEFVKNQSAKPIEVQVIIFFVFLLIPVSLLCK
ncbi:hypothetical protein NPIL_651251 [Nephila pilipes]|uniref:Uncharacterized protein n=1 Tax=Nephila pilipes TaxID=299642 RepID=A0A8X6PFT3_NEPPI|nr:hypothetical protein NPIL_651251 [Nephila pilipes]